MNIRARRRNIPDVSITKNSDESAAINEGLNLIQANNLINTNDVVVITPNWVNQNPPQAAITSGPESLREIIKFAKQANPKRIVVATGSAEKSTAQIMNTLGFDKVMQEENVEFVDLNCEPFTTIELNHDSPSFTNINKLYDEMTFLISFTQLKHHEEATMSACIKNIALGWPPAAQHGYPKKDLGIHNKLHEFIRAMAEKVTIDLSILSTNPAMVGTGPSKGLPCYSQIVICGTDPVAVDTIGARLLGLKPQGIHYLFECSNMNIGISDIDKINISGLPLVDAEKEFSTAVYGQPIIIN